MQSSSLHELLCLSLPRLFFPSITVFVDLFGSSQLAKEALDSLPNFSEQALQQCPPENASSECKWNFGADKIKMVSFCFTPGDYRGWEVSWRETSLVPYSSTPLSGSNQSKSHNNLVSGTSVGCIYSSSIPCVSFIWSCCSCWPSHN